MLSVSNGCRFGSCFQLCSIKEFAVDISHYAAPGERTKVWVIYLNSLFQTIECRLAPHNPNSPPGMTPAWTYTQLCVGWDEEGAKPVPLREPARTAKPQTKTRPQRHGELGSAETKRRKLLGWEAFGVLAVVMIWQAPESKAPGIAVITTQDSCDMSCTNSEGEENPSIVLFNRACAPLKNTGMQIHHT